MPYNAEINVDVVEPMGSDTLVWTRFADEEFRFRVGGQSPIAEGETVLIGFDPATASLFDRETELRL